MHISRLIVAGTATLFVLIVTGVFALYIAKTTRDIPSTQTTGDNVTEFNQAELEQAKQSFDTLTAGLYCVRDACFKPIGKHFGIVRIIDASALSTGSDRIEHPVTEAKVTLGILDSSQQKYFGYFDTHSCKAAFEGNAITKLTNHQGYAFFSADELAQLYQSKGLGEVFAIYVQHPNYAWTLRDLDGKEMNKRSAFESEIFMIGEKSKVKTAEEATQLILANKDIQDELQKEKKELSDICSWNGQWLGHVGRYKIILDANTGKVMLAVYGHSSS